MYCRICGTKDTQFQISGKYGCEHCVTVFPVPKQSRRLWIPTSLLTEIEEIFSNSQSKIQFLSYRTRITRNLAHSLFPFYEPKEMEVKLLLAESGFWKDPKEGPNSFTVSKEGISPIYHLYLGAEDHVRLEILRILDLSYGQLQNAKKTLQARLSKEKRSLLRLFYSRKHWAYRQGIGFISSCPTNLGKGRRDSLLLGIKEGVDPRFFSLFEKLSEFGIEIAPSTDHRRESLGNFRGLVVKISWKNAFAVQKRQFYKILGLRGSL
ncbi:ATP--guanido phosphotransferase [Leptospira levettii]|uniref:ATP--guanido phosphotransferase n=1 Tax=Leptospira levettii TaxID=2023178 RepID=A0ABY2MRX4_9LEPT|nr:ATP--guanido phosphotransferase [Leptospira levettii]TGM31186.1 ATP--guanido phosphotransferase [Leptospira levettii]TGM85866.1 ATP--guanido phosphotransferase [Leptospira levettii]